MHKDIIYEKIKKMIREFNLAPEEYQKKIKELTDILDI